MILGTTQRCNQWNPYERRQAAKAYESLVCHSSTRGVPLFAWAISHGAAATTHGLSLLAFTSLDFHG
jgi:hypothetical protein